jgi:hypothetical protein
MSAHVSSQVLRTRALQCSFSPVFHLRRAGMNIQDATYIENIFLFTVGLPIAIMGTAGALLSFANTDQTKTFHNVKSLDVAIQANQT